MSGSSITAGQETGFDSAETTIDFSAPFLPEPLTQLYYTPSLSRLDAVQRLRYNQLYAAHVNEQFIFFEHNIGNAITRVLLKSNAIESQPLRERLQTMIDDEERHQCMFESINRHAFPELYARGRHRFVRPSAVARQLLNVLVRHPSTMTLVIWLAFFLEEASTAFSSQLVQYAKKGTAVEPHFLDLHIRHLRDEVHHVKLYPEILRAVLDQSSPLARKVNAMLLVRVMREFLAPKRSGIAVIDQLVREFPELGPVHADLRRDIRSLASSPEFHEAFFAADMLPRLHSMFDEYPEFSWSATGIAARHG